jgi:hypothetical protein
VLKEVLNKARRKEIEDLTLTKVIVVKEFYINIILKAYLKLKGV